MKTSPVPFTELAPKCEMTESYELDYKTFHVIESMKNSHADGYVFSLSFLVFGDKEVHVLLSEAEQANAEAQPAYEIGKLYHFMVASATT